MERGGGEGERRAGRVFGVPHGHRLINNGQLDTASTVVAVAGLAPAHADRGWLGWLVPHGVDSVLNCRCAHCYQSWFYGAAKRVGRMTVATKARGLLFCGVIVVAGVVVAPKLVDRAGSALGEMFGVSDPVVVGEGESSIMVAVDAKPKIAPCPTAEILQSKVCDDMKFVIIDAAKMSFIACKIQLAWGDGHPFASTREGGDAARTEEVHRDEQNCQGGTLSRAYQDRIAQGEQFVVVISHPDSIAKQPWRGEEVRPIGC